MTPTIVVEGLYLFDDVRYPGTLTLEEDHMAPDSDQPNAGVSCEEQSARFAARLDAPRDGDSPFFQIVSEIVDMHDRKQKDYGTDGDPLANVRASEAFGIPAWVGCMVRANDKMKRLQTFAQKGALENESVEDSLLDLAVYAIIGLQLYRETTNPS